MKVILPVFAPKIPVLRPIQAHDGSQFPGRLFNLVVQTRMTLVKDQALFVFESGGPFLCNMHKKGRRCFGPIMPGNAVLPA